MYCVPNAEKLTVKHMEEKSKPIAHSFKDTCGFV
jgi:hypothetical protein